MTLVNDLGSLYRTDLIPQRWFEAIQQKCSTKEEVATECASYYVHVHPEASWTYLASWLYNAEEFAAVEKLKPFLPLRGNHQVISYAGMNHALQACTVCVFCHGLHNVQQKLYDDDCVWQAAANSVTLLPW